MPYQTQANEALEVWRQAGRRLAETDPDSIEYEELVAACRRAQRRYLEAVGHAAGEDALAVEDHDEVTQGADEATDPDWNRFGRPF
jgi:hypothetical protein